MSYGIKYKAQFDSVSDANTVSKRYFLEILFKDYSGGATSVTLGPGGVVQSCTVDDPMAPIKGQSLSISLLNINQSLPITSFYSDDEAGVQVILRDETDAIKFIGFVVQEDSYEVNIDFTHEIVLSANDSLGLLKGVILSDAEVTRPFEVRYATDTAFSNVLLVYTTNTAFYPSVPGTITIQGVDYAINAAVQGSYTFGGNSYNWRLTIIPAPPIYTDTTDTVLLTSPLNLLKRNSLLSVIAACLNQTNLERITNIFHNVFEVNHDTTRSAFEQTLVDTQLFISGETYQDCYTVLSSIMETFRCSLFQANGVWNIVHWDELPLYTNNQIPGFVYGTDMVFLNNTVLDNNFFIGIDPAKTRPIYPNISNSFRAYKFSRKTFNYVQPKYLLRNFDLSELGTLRSEYISSGFRIREYDAPGWTTFFGATASDRFIRVVYDLTLQRETDRYLVIRGSNSDDPRSVGSDPIEVNASDKMKFSFSFRTNFSQGGPATIIFAVQVTDGVNTKYVDEVPAGNGSWINTLGFNYSILSGDNFDTTHSVEIASSQIPFSGLMTCWLSNRSPASGHEVHYKDIRLEYIPYINDSTKITGQIHKQEQTKNIKNNSDVEIRMDDSPRNPIAGTLFLPTVTNLLQDRTLAWKYKTLPTTYKLGELTTKEDLRCRETSDRSKIEGSYVGMYQDNCISLLTPSSILWKPTKTYVPGLMSIDYKNNQFNCTLWEIFDSTEPALVNLYTFTYIYSTT